MRARCRAPAHGASPRAHSRCERARAVASPCFAARVLRARSAAHTRTPTHRVCWRCLHVSRRSCARCERERAHREQRRNNVVRACRFVPLARHSSVRTRDAGPLSRARIRKRRRDAAGSRPAFPRISIVFDRPRGVKCKARVPWLDRRHRQNQLADSYRRAYCVASLVFWRHHLLRVDQRTFAMRRRVRRGPRVNRGAIDHEDDARDERLELLLTNSSAKHSARNT
jgi:hypothetical protein